MSINYYNAMFDEIIKNRDWYEGRRTYTAYEAFIQKCYVIYSRIYVLRTNGLIDDDETDKLASAVNLTKEDMKAQCGVPRFDKEPGYTKETWNKINQVYEAEWVDQFKKKFKDGVNDED